jgi:hypothetical protein
MQALPNVSSAGDTVPGMQSPYLRIAPSPIRTMPIHHQGLQQGVMSSRHGGRPTDAVQHGLGVPMWDGHVASIARAPLSAMESAIDTHPDDQARSSSQDAQAAQVADQLRETYSSLRPAAENPIVDKMADSLGRLVASAPWAVERLQFAQDCANDPASKWEAVRACTELLRKDQTDLSSPYAAWIMEWTLQSIAEQQVVLRPNEISSITRELLGRVLCHADPQVILCHVEDLLTAVPNLRESDAVIVCALGRRCVSTSLEAAQRADDTPLLREGAAAILRMRARATFMLKNYPEEFLWEVQQLERDLKTVASWPTFTVNWHVGRLLSELQSIVWEAKLSLQDVTDTRYEPLNSLGDCVAALQERLIPE